MQAAATVLQMMEARQRGGEDAEYVCRLRRSGFMKSDFSLGDRVKLSALGERRCPRLAGKSGTVVGRSIYVNSVAVLFDGNKSPRTFHGAYLEAVKEHVA
jgi:hypothetical protein